MALALLDREDGTLARVLRGSAAGLKGLWKSSIGTAVPEEAVEN
jgi:hypothetical protein